MFIFPSFIRETHYKGNWCNYLVCIHLRWGPLRGEGKGIKKMLANEITTPRHFKQCKTISILKVLE